MKICAIICEFNPFHNGHKYLLDTARGLSGCDSLVLFMSGSFSQRGEMCRTDKFLRAKHALLGGADAVIELPPHFAVAPAEIFAKGAVKLIASLNMPTVLAFGCESGQKESFIKAAEILKDESGIFKDTLARGLGDGESYIKSYSAAFCACGGESGLLSSPNNILGAEYAKAAMRTGADIEILPVKRVGSGYGDNKLYENFSSAGAIRANAGDPAAAENMPDYSYRDFTASPDCTKRFKTLAADFLFLCDKENLKRVYGCTEGLENRLKKLAAVHCGDYDKIVTETCSKRYTESRIRRILCANLLNLYADDAEKLLNSKFPLKILAVKKERADKLLPILARPCADGVVNAYPPLPYSLWRYLNPLSPYENPNEKMIIV